MGEGRERRRGGGTKETRSSDFGQKELMRTSSPQIVPSLAFFNESGEVSKTNSNCFPHVFFASKM